MRTRFALPLLALPLAIHAQPGAASGAISAPPVLRRGSLRTLTRHSVEEAQDVYERELAALRVDAKVTISSRSGTRASN